MQSETTKKEALKKDAFRRKWLPIFLVAAASIVLFFVLYSLPEVKKAVSAFLAPLSPVIYGVAIAYILTPGKKFFQRHFTRWLCKKQALTPNREKAAKMLAITTVMLLFLAFVAGFCFLLFPELYRSVASLVEQFPQKSAQVVEWFEKLGVDTAWAGSFETLVTTALDNVQKWINTHLMDAVTNVVAYLTNGVISVVKQIFYLVIGFVVTVYALSEEEHFKKQSKMILYALVEPSKANDFMDSMRHGNQIFSSFLTGKLIDSLLVGIVCFIGMSAIGLPYAILISVIIAITDLIPVFGPFIGTIPCAILILIENPISCLYFLIFILVLQQIDGNIIAPRILGEATGISTFWVTFSLLLFGGIFGIMGMILGVPLFSVLYYLAKMFVNRQLEKRSLPADADWEQLDRVDASGKLIIVTKEEKEAIREAKAEKERQQKKEHAARRRTQKTHHTEKTSDFSGTEEVSEPTQQKQPRVQDKNADRNEE